MLSRRGMLSGMIAAGLWPAQGWADVGGPRYLAAAQHTAGGYALHGVSVDGVSLFSVPLPTRGHAAAAHPTRAEAVAFARRPGTYAIVLDCLSGEVKAELTAPEGRHFYGHGAFSADGSLLFTTENDFETARGVVGVWDVAGGYTRLWEFSSGGVGPHELRLMPDGQTLAIGNGGIETHPEAGRAKLNIPFMAPNLTYVSLSGEILEQVAPPDAEHKNSMRHLAVGPDGQVALALQWQGEVTDAPALLMLHKRGQAPVWARAPEALHAAMEGYAGSVSFSGDGRQVGITSPRGGRVQVFDAASAVFQNEVLLRDVCGLAPGTDGFVASTGQGVFHALNDGQARVLQDQAVAWDNHIVPIGAATRSA
ncbi:hypothetical protein GGQ68_002894 [Sagittula marina]|uniref:Twin-arginine translocation pathway signal n=1 Tax=Sagittula marina TaxID=943940 RepID=A0A7W6GSK5_9RHOB|nr:DUF1513 domain-containing protein [Sagittula marina]MBB3986551.1 hypothetical protein [Sagittula marina]